MKIAWNAAKTSIYNVQKNGMDIYSGSRFIST